MRSAAVLIACALFGWSCRREPPRRAPAALPSSTSVVASGDGACAVSRSGTLRCWGRSNPVRTIEVSRASNATDTLVMSDDARCVLRRDATSSCDILPGDERDDLRPTLETVRREVVPHARAIAFSGPDFGCALDAFASAWCWGSFSPSAPSPRTPFRIAIESVRALAVTASAIYVVDTRGRLLRARRAFAVPSFDEVPEIKDAEEVVAGRGFACVRTSVGEVHCAGGLLDEHEPEGAFRRVTRLPPAARIVADASSTARWMCAITTEHRAICVEGTNVRDIGVDRIDSIAVATQGPDAGLCIRRSNGEVRCTDAALGGPRRNGPLIDRPELRAMTSIGIGPVCRDQAVCGIGANGEVRCVGRFAAHANVAPGERSLCSANAVGTPTRGSPPAPNDVREIPIRGPIRWLARNEERVCASGAQGAFCFRDGPGSVSLEFDTSLARAAAAAIGLAHQCTITDTHAHCSGASDLFQSTPSGDGSVDLADVRAVVAGANHTCVLRSSRGVACWGDDLDGQSSGSGRSGEATRIVEVPGLGPSTSVCAGDHHSCALGDDGRVRCWGRNREREANPASDAEIIGPTVVPFGARASAIACGGTATCAIASGRAHCWGSISIGYGAPAREVRRVAELDDAVVVTVGRDHACALDSMGSVSCWGESEHGQLGGDPPTMTACETHGIECDAVTPAPSPMRARLVRFRP
jgi:hypothetical protein